jgi:hypothetical protein
VCPRALYPHHFPLCPPFSAPLSLPLLPRPHLLLYFPTPCYTHVGTGTLRLKAPSVDGDAGEGDGGRREEGGDGAGGDVGVRGGPYSDEDGYSEARGETKGEEKATASSSSSSRGDPFYDM